jgi:hypothetical protein
MAFWLRGLKCWYLVLGGVTVGRGFEPQSDLELFFAEILIKWHLSSFRYSECLRLKSLGIQMFVYWVLGIMCWLSDKFQCSHWQSINFPYLHCIWHVFIVLAGCITIVICIFYHSMTVISEQRPMIRYWPKDNWQYFGVPYVAFKRGPFVWSMMLWYCSTAKFPPGTGHSTGHCPAANFVFLTSIPLVRTHASTCLMKPDAICIFIGPSIYIFISGSPICRALFFKLIFKKNKFLYFYYRMLKHY